MSLLTMARDAALLVGLSQPTSVVSSSEDDDKLLTLLATRAGREVALFHDWSGLSASGSFTGDGATVDFILPADFDRFGEGHRILLDGGVGEVVHGPLTPEEITSYLARMPTSVSYVTWRRGRTLTIRPAIEAGRRALYEYQSRRFVVPATGPATDAFAADTDTVDAFPEDLVMLGIVWMWKRQKGLDYAQEYEIWRQECQLHAGRDRGLIPVSAGPALTDLPTPVTPDTIIVGG